MDDAPKPPAELAKLQAAFGKSIAAPLEFLDDDGNYTLRFEAYDAHALRAVKGRGEQTSAERIGVYNQQYWFRLLTIMQEEFPLTEALLGVQKFNRLAMDYIHHEPPDSARLRDLSNRFERYVATQDMSLAVREAIVLERIFIESFDAAQLSTPQMDSPEVAHALATRPLRFQPHFALFEARTNVAELRPRVKRGEPITADFIEEKSSSRAYWRGNGIQSVELGRIQALLLAKLVAGIALADACEALVDELDDQDVEFFARHVQRWFAAWATAGWFAAPVDL